MGLETPAACATGDGVKAVPPEGVFDVLKYPLKPSMGKVAPPGPVNEVGMDVKVTEAGEEGEPENTSWPAFASVAEIVFATFCVTEPNVSVRVLDTLMAAFTDAVAFTVPVTAFCAGLLFATATTANRAQTSQRVIKRVT